jgi:hypothetical protein
MADKLAEARACWQFDRSGRLGRVNQ